MINERINLDSSSQSWAFEFFGYWEVIMEQIDIMLMFTEKHDELAKDVSHYLMLDNSEAIEIHYKNGKIQVWSYYDDILVTVRD